ncbi:MAG: EXS family-domain-containing protein [Benjaminiella poitrasii]|nr:MAG: EXS family-domain-containing protein [Benjaminiella poitrasii]
MLLNTTVVTEGEPPSLIPESYRPLIIICFGLWGWIIATNTLSWQKINVNTVLYQHSMATDYSTSSRSLFIFATILTSIISFHIMVLEPLFMHHTQYVMYKSGPVILCHTIVIAVAIFGPCRRECYSFLKCLYRLLFKLHYHQIHFSDVIVADILISFSGVPAEVYTQLIQSYNLSPLLCYEPYVTSLPFLIRLKQCLNDYFSQKQPRSNRRQLINAFKYASAIPVIFLSHHTSQITHFGTYNLQEKRNDKWLWHIWFISAMSSTLFAFSWDLIIDWGLIQISQQQTSVIFHARKDLYFSDPVWYLFAVLLNGSFRTLKIASHLYRIHPFCIDMAEIVRRWVWVIFRFENDWIKRSYNEQKT